MANTEHLQKLNQDVRGWNAWRQEHPEIRVDFSNADLNGRDLSGRDLSRAKLGGANLRRANLRGADLSEAHLDRVKLSGADLSEARLFKRNFSKKNLSGTNLREVNLSKADRSGASLNDAILTDAWLWETQWAGWSIQGIICEAAYWDRNRQERTIYKPGEFELLYADKNTTALPPPATATTRADNLASIPRKELQRLIKLAGINHDVKTEDWLIELAQSHPDSFLRRSAINALGELRSIKARPIFITILTTERRNQNLRESAITALGKTGDVETANILRGLIQSETIARYG